MRRSHFQPVPRLRFVAIGVLILVALVVAFLVACPPSPAPGTLTGPSVPGGTETVPQPRSEGSAPRPVATSLLPPERPQPEERGMIAVIIDDAGYDLGELQKFLDLPIPLTVAVLPNLPHSPEAARRVIAASKDLIVHGPMEPDGGQDPGPGAILTSQSPETIRQLLDADFASVPGAIGLNNHMGSKATADENVMRVVLAYLKEHGKLFIDSRTTAETAGPRIARDLGLPILQRDVFLDDQPDASDITAWLTRSIDEARTRGTAVVIGHVQNGGVADILRAAEGGLASQGVRFAHLHEVLSARERKTAR